MRHFTSMILTLTLITGAVAQDLKTNTIGTDIGALAAGGTVLEYQKLINDGKNEIGVGGGPLIGVMMPPGPADGHGTVSTKMVMEKAYFILSAVLQVQHHGTIRQMKG